MASVLSTCGAQQAKSEVYSHLECNASVSLRAQGRNCEGKCVYNIMASNHEVFSRIHVQENEEYVEMKDLRNNALCFSEGGLSSKVGVMVVRGFDRAGKTVKIAEVHHNTIFLIYDGKRDNSSQLTIKHPPEHVQNHDAKISIKNVNGDNIGDLSKRNCSAVLSFGLPVGTGRIRSLCVLYALKVYHSIYKLHEYSMPQNILWELTPGNPCPPSLNSLSETSRFTLRAACKGLKRNRFTDLLDGCSGIIKLVIEEDPCSQAHSIVFRDTFGYLQFYSSFGKDKNTVALFSDTGNPIGMFFKNVCEYTVIDTEQNSEIFTIHRKESPQLMFVVVSAECPNSRVACIYQQQCTIIVDISDSKLISKYKALIITFAQSQSLLLHKSGEGCLPMVPCYPYRPQII
ncbi:hypothetical protein EB796_019266 [Bugula neritina]|uniref:Uncharacterized protein n=1 Tax=Bugula neritina TaxID=10212 RepID=A0A7J7J863_BUGNE|nr:hypothetical protein EB796_019266 [Bugula neritina]